MPTTRHPGFAEPNKPQGGPEGEFKPAVPELTIGTPPEQAPTASQEVQQASAPEDAPETPATQDNTVQPSPATTMAEQHAALDKPITTQSVGQDEQGPAEELPATEDAATPAEKLAAPHVGDGSMTDQQASLVPDTTAGSSPPQAEKHKGWLSRLIDKVSAGDKDAKRQTRLQQAGVNNTGESTARQDTSEIDTARRARLLQAAEDNPVADNDTREYIDGVMGTIDPNDPTKRVNTQPDEHTDQAA
jgi:hypothetical protein